MNNNTTFIIMIILVILPQIQNAVSNTLWLGPGRNNLGII